jgi:hypothetical protein
VHHLIHKHFLTLFSIIVSVLFLTMRATVFQACCSIDLRGQGERVPRLEWVDLLTIVSVIAGARNQTAPIITWHVSAEKSWQYRFLGTSTVVSRLELVQTGEMLGQLAQKCSMIEGPSRPNSTSILLDTPKLDLVHLAKRINCGDGSGSPSV